MNIKQGFDFLGGRGFPPTSSLPSDRIMQISSKKQNREVTGRTLGTRLLSAALSLDLKHPHAYFKDFNLYLKKIYILIILFILPHWDHHKTQVTTPQTLYIYSTQTKPSSCPKLYISSSWQIYQLFPTNSCRHATWAADEDGCTLKVPAAELVTAKVATRRQPFLTPWMDY